MRRRPGIGGLQTSAAARVCVSNLGSTWLFKKIIILCINMLILGFSCSCNTNMLYNCVHQFWVLHDYTKNNEFMHKHVDPMLGYSCFMFLSITCCITMLIQFWAFLVLKCYMLGNWFQDQYRKLGENVAKLKMDLMKEQLATFRSQLEDFARKHKVPPRLLIFLFLISVD